MIVVDASVLAPALADDGPSGDTARTLLMGEAIATPAVVDLEVMSVIRGHLRAGKLDQRRAELALADLADLPAQRALPGPLLDRVWSLRDNLSPYDAAYVALAEVLGAPLVTADRRLAAATGPRCIIELLSAST